MIFFLIFIVIVGSNEMKKISDQANFENQGTSIGQQQQQRWWWLYLWKTKTKQKFNNYENLFSMYVFLGVIIVECFKRKRKKKDSWLASSFEKCIKSKKEKCTGVPYTHTHNTINRYFFQRRRRQWTRVIHKNTMCKVKEEKIFFFLGGSSYWIQYWSICK